MYQIFPIFIILIIFISIFPEYSFAHKSWCHRWHTCSSDTGSYSYTPKIDKSEDEKPTYDKCPNGYNKNHEGICEKKIDNNKKENKNSFKEKDYSYNDQNDLGSTKNNFFDISPDDYYSPDYTPSDTQTDSIFEFSEDDYLPNGMLELENNYNWEIIPEESVFDKYKKIKSIIRDDNNNKQEIIIVGEKNNCPTHSENVELNEILNPKGIRLLADFYPCKIVDGDIILNIPQTPIVKLAIMYIDYNGNNHAGALITPSKIQSIDKNQGLFSVELDSKMKGLDPLTGKTNTIKKINGLALYNDGDKPIIFKPSNIAMLTSTFTK